ncbi:hypothetical protein [Mycobacterium sp. 1081908.1]|uniref:hypothetical protein n=1 Tax=Mycobacterium sp. 1081908.1 TaxID=1834066 RepID=UPI000801E34D|nr:hypothetical protein [Mycobacterium sp. 1081908.1]OBK49702.1 hypothetical protein A5655_02015 [Mycobacterium sp. 1081908.1]
MKTSSGALAHRLRQARAVALRAQLALTGAQILFWVALIGAPVGLALRARRRRARRELPRSGGAPPLVN